MITNDEFLHKVRDILAERNMSLYALKKKINDDILKDSTYYTMSQKNSTVKIEYICEISRALGISTADMIGEDESEKYLSPVQIEILNEFDGLDEAMLKRVLPIVKGVILAEKSRK